MSAILAQTFFVDRNLYREGVFISSVDLFFANKDSSGILPVEVQLRTTRNGFPMSGYAIPNSKVSVDTINVKTSDLPDSNDPDTLTTFTFPAPVYLEPGGEYALVVYSDSPEYVLFSAKVGQTIVGSDRSVSKQPYTGVLYRPQNSSLWIPALDEDLMFVMRKCVFTTGSSGTALFNVRTPSSNVEMDLMYVRSDQIKFATSTLDYSYKATPKSTAIVDSSFTSFLTNKDYEFSDGAGRRIIQNSNQFILKPAMSTLNSDVSPVIDVQRLGLFAIQNIINNANISNSVVVVTDGGAGHTSPTVTISGGGGSGATATANVVAGVVRSISVTSAGSGYTTTPTITISEGGATRNASAIVLGETRNSGGNYVARYISRRVELADGFDSGDLRVFLTAFKPSATDIQVYYKIMNADDSEDFDLKNYYKMEQYTPSGVKSTNYNDYVEYEYRPSLNTNFVVYSSGTTSYDSFKYFSIKIVMSSSDTTIVPKIRDMRVIALPAA
jgi:hypothetical protein